MSVHEALRVKRPKGDVGSCGAESGGWAGLNPAELDTWATDSHLRLRGVLSPGEILALRRRVNSTIHLARHSPRCPDLRNAVEASIRSIDLRRVVGDLLGFEVEVRHVRHDLCPPSGPGRTLERSELGPSASIMVPLDQLNSTASGVSVSAAGMPRPPIWIEPGDLLIISPGCAVARTSNQTAMLRRCLWLGFGPARSVAGVPVEMELRGMT